jgi:hypothetical protein
MTKKFSTVDVFRSAKKENRIKFLMNLFNDFVRSTGEELATFQEIIVEILIIILEELKIARLKKLKVLTWNYSFCNYMMTFFLEVILIGGNFWK